MVNSTVEKLNPTRVKLVVTANYEDLKPSFDYAYKYIAEQVSIPGFRKGKVPAPIIDQRVGREEVLNQAVNNGLDSLYQSALAEHNLRPMARPEADVTKWLEVKDFSGELVVEIEVEVRPEFDLPDLKKLKVKVDDATASDEEVDKELEELRARFGTLVTVDRPAEKGDFVQLDLVAEIDGTEVDSANSISYEVGSGELLEGIDEAVETLTAGEETTFNSVLMGGEHEGETASVKVTVHSVKERQLPDADDDFAQMASQYDTIDELKVELKDQVLKSKRFAQFSAARNELVDLLIEMTDLPVSEKIIEAEVNHHLEGENRLEDEEHRKEVIESSTKALKQQLILDKIGEDRDVQIGQEEFSRYIVQSAAQYGIDPNEFVKLLEQQGQIPSVIADLARSKAITLLLGEIKVTDASGAELDFTEFLPKEDEAGAPIFTDDAELEHADHNH